MKLKLWSSRRAIRGLASSFGQYLPLLLPAVHLVIIIFGFQKFKLWDQVVSISGENPIELLLTGHPHALRLALVKPAFLVSDLLGADRDLVFSIGVWIGVVGVGYMIAILFADYFVGDPVQRTRAFLISYTLTALMSMAMNGRLIFVLIGFSIILISQARWLQPVQSGRSTMISIAGLFAGLMLTNVSSGTFMVAAVDVMLFTALVAFAQWPRLAYRNAALIGLVSVAVVALAPVAAVYVSKNLAFYDWSALNLLDHGFGRIVVNMPPEYAAILVAGGLLLLGVGAACVKAVASRASKNSAVLPLAILVSCAIPHGVFGYSTLLSATPALLFLATAAPWLIRRTRLRIHGNKIQITCPKLWPV